MAPSAQNLIDLAKQRRSYYPLNKELPVASARVEEIVKDLLDQVPSSFNSQSNRTVVLFGAEHDKLWDITAEILKPMVPAEQWEGTSKKMAMFKAAAGSVRLFFLFLFLFRSVVPVFLPSPLLFSPPSLVSPINLADKHHHHPPANRSSST